MIEDYIAKIETVEEILDLRTLLLDRYTEIKNK